MQDITAASTRINANPNPKTFVGELETWNPKPKTLLLLLYSLYRS